MESDARADFEGASAAVVGQEGRPVGESGSPVSSFELDRAGYVSQDQLSAWIEEHLIPKLTLLTERMDGFELDLGAHKQRTDDQHATAMETPGEYVETFNRAQAAHDEAHAALESRIAVCEEALVNAGPQLSPEALDSLEARVAALEAVAPQSAPPADGA